MEGGEEERTLAVQRTFTCIMSKYLSFDKEGRGLILIVCGLDIMNIHRCLAHLLTFICTAIA